MSGTGRLPTLSSKDNRPSLKFKPKAIARKSKEEREAAAAKIKTEEKDSFNNKNYHGDNKKKYSKRLPGIKKQPRYLQNTHVISSGPLAAGNFVSGGSSRTTSFFRKGDQASAAATLLKKGIAGKDADEENDDDNGTGIAKLNMGREYKTLDILSSDDDDDDDDGGNEEENNNGNENNASEPSTSAAMNSEDPHLISMFPVRPIRINHEEINTAKIEVQQSMSTTTSKEPTPGFIKLEEINNENNLLEKKKAELNKRLEKMNLGNEFKSVNVEESLEEMKLMVKDYIHINKKLEKVHNSDRQFLAFQIPPIFPTTTVVEDSTNKNTTITPLTGNIGRLRIHKSGKITIKIAGVVMDITKGSETSFIQDVVALDSHDEETVEHLGQIESKIIAIPKI
ncbi:related to DNA-directed RNA polymerase III subunit RPC4 [Saccharomycodes ludwigii]|uniref:Related to DNA-directed RNA polymerase III subunit RPC4 n=1 Tax=Saccharomycodes ludwigii TaxID=36035 RepID=A0A376B7Q6_9ASCO|nr:hypothetical protein SCDLUD_000253 [Saccharomycodes ludwigii]KAH3902670.1 hypothetical protein SCDLUD_000253 [Saccharomycodes ludwigii]SSD60534.1 related to DNA-directed RNA polymerase III subunit RPC4 [Saccharomycodes ludwigii]